MDFEEMYARIERNFDIINKLENGEPVILNETDIKYTREEIKKSNDRDYFYGERRKFEKVEDIMLVHKTNYAPQNSTIGTRISSNVVDQVPVIVFDKEFFINARPCRNTVHFSVNHEVSGNSGGNWYSCKYAVITPLVNIPKEQVISNRCVDTFTDGPVALKEGSYLLCPKDEMEAVKLMNPGVKVVGYEGDNAQDYADALLWLLGYPVAYGNDWGFSSDHTESYKKVLKEAGYENFDAHYYSETKKVEDADWNISYAVGMLELIINNPDIPGDDTYELAKQTMLFQTICYCDTATPGYFNKLLAEIGMKESFPGSFKDADEFENYVLSLVEEAKQLRVGMTQ